MNELALSDKRLIAEFVASALRLSVLDKIWTNHLTENRQNSDVELQELTTITDEMDVSFVRVSSHVRRVRKVYEGHPGVIEYAHQRMLSADDFPENDKRRWENLVERRGGIVKIALSSTSFVEQNFESERSEIRSKINLLTAGRSSEGDMRPSFECGLMIGLAIGCGIGEIWPLAFMAAAAAGKVCAER